ncbi:phage late control D family protein [Haematospirillum jordaniae]|uniref:phage late control D family protein n=1 Tax=Haematospirillum jordaniae TaxID=1549855 RepID=UPI00143300EC|nr:contractile injection system protein, VgrG/Pvc8 family [Haematospirillum jordaniae]NKD93131.1 late control protein D [Haematospirillum jordaniae]
MGIKPGFQIRANDADITAGIRSHLVSFRLTDEAGLQSDTLELMLADPNDRKPLALPAAGTELCVALGYDNALRKMGLFIVDELEVSGPPDRITVKAKASVQAASTSEAGSRRPMLTTQKNRSWAAGTTLGDMVQVIAQEHGLKAAVAPALAATSLPHVDQANESDMALLTRLSKDYDALAKPAGGHLVIAKRGESKTTTGKPLPVVAVARSEITQYRVTITKRQPVGQVITQWNDLDAGMVREVVAGQGEPVARIRHPFADAAGAKQAAVAELEKRARAEKQLSLTLPGNPTLIAEARVELKGFRSSANGLWLITRAEHSLSRSGYTTTLTCESVSD